MYTSMHSGGLEAKKLTYVPGSRITSYGTYLQRKSKSNQISRLNASVSARPKKENDAPHFSRNTRNFRCTSLSFPWCSVAESPLKNGFPSTRLAHACVRGGTIDVCVGSGVTLFHKVDAHVTHDININNYQDCKSSGLGPSKNQNMFGITPTGIDDCFLSRHLQSRLSDEPKV